MADDEATHDEARAIAAHRARYGVILTWVAVALFVLAYVWLVADAWAGSDLCGSAISNPGWNDSQDCWSTLYRRSLLGWSAVILGGASLAAAARYRWGPGWLRQRSADGLSGV